MFLVGFDVLRTVFMGLFCRKCLTGVGFMVKMGWMVRTGKILQKSRKFSKKSLQKVGTGV